MRTPLSVLLLLSICSPAVAAERAVFLFELSGTPVGTVELSLDVDRGEYRYTSVQLFTRDEHKKRRVRTEAVKVTPALIDSKRGLALESLSLWKGPRRPGCIQVREELGTREGPLCFTEVHPERVKGTVYGQPFQATLDPESQELQALTLQAARFVRVDGAAKLEAPPDLFASGWPVEGRSGPLAALRGSEESKPLETEPSRKVRPWKSLQQARALSREVHLSFAEQRASEADFAADERADSASCMGHVRRFVDRARKLGQDAAVVHGLVVEEDSHRAFPHVWVRVRHGHGKGHIDLDPTWDVAPRRATHLPLAVVAAHEQNIAGDVWLEVVSGRLRPVRKSDGTAADR